MDTKEPNNGDSESVSPELIILIRSLAAKQQMAKATYDAVIREVSSQYKLMDGDHVDLATGKIARKAKDDATS